LNRAVALGMAFGPQAGLTHLDAVEGLDGYHLLPSVRGDLLAKLGRAREARAQFERAASMTAHEAERDLLPARAEALAWRPAPQRPAHAGRDDAQLRRVADRAGVRQVDLTGAEGAAAVDRHLHAARDRDVDRPEDVVHLQDGLGAVQRRLAQVEVD